MKMPLLELGRAEDGAEKDGHNFILDIDPNEKCL
jgi:hypothetical protein